MYIDDETRLRHMLDAAREVRSFVVGATRADLDRDRKLALALQKSLETIGEAASKVAPDTRTKLPQLPWPKIVGMRHRLVHAYFTVDLDEVWRVSVEEMAPLVEALGAFLPPWEEPA